MKSEPSSKSKNLSSSKSRGILRSSSNETYRVITQSFQLSNPSSSIVCENIQIVLANVIPKLSFEHSKGECGKICIVGGSRFCAEAPVMTALTTLNIGADLVVIITTPSAAKSIKCYNPLLHVVPYLPEDDWVTPEESMVDRVWPLVHDSDVFCFGPGLRTNDCTREAVSNLLYKVRGRGVPVVIDADMEWLLDNDMDLLNDNFPKSPVIVAQNTQEFQSLWLSVHNRGLMSFHPSESESEDRPEGVPRQARRRRGSHEACPLSETITAECPSLREFNVKDFPNVTCLTETAHLARALGKNVIIVRKGKLDIITDGFKCILCCGLKIPRGCAGQGNVLVGVAATFAAWMKRSEIGKTEVANKPLVVAYGACLLTRLAAIDAYEVKKRALTAYDIISFLSSVVFTVQKAFNESEESSTTRSIKNPNNESVLAETGETSI